MGWLRMFSNLDRCAWGSGGVYLPSRLPNSMDCGRGILLGFCCGLDRHRIGTSVCIALDVLRRINSFRSIW